MWSTTFRSVLLSLVTASAVLGAYTHSVVPISTTTAAWTPTPKTSQHHTLLNEVFTTPDDSSYITTSVAGTEIERVRVGVLPRTTTHVSSFVVKVRTRFASTSGTLHIQLYDELTLIGSTSVPAGFAGTFTNNHLPIAATSRPSSASMLGGLRVAMYLECPTTCTVDVSALTLDLVDVTHRNTVL